MAMPMSRNSVSQYSLATRGWQINSLSRSFLGLVNADECEEDGKYKPRRKLAEREGFEPPLPFRVNTLSKRAPSATRPSLRRESVGERLFTEASPLRFESGESSGSYVRFNSMGEVVETATCRERVNIRKLHVGRCDPQLQSPRICRVGFC